jgi:diaminohydroxyphosphoribosylaminopyrimidine deaminase/5-amino-6-(5-phosphoribosylamino)uracil reductase
MTLTEKDQLFMLRALELAAGGEGLVEPNPMVGCVIVQKDRVVAEGYHAQFGGPHAEIEALQRVAGQAAGATMYVTLEPCCHQGKTPPCSKAIIDAGIQRVVIASVDPYAEVDGSGIEALEAAGIVVSAGVVEDEARDLNAAYFKRIETGRPWVIAKWAMTLDGMIATAKGNSQWISSEASRKIVHELRGRMDAIVVGRRTAEEDDPLLTARPDGPRTAARVILDSHAQLASSSQLVKTARETPVLVVTQPGAPAESVARLVNAGCEVFGCQGETPVVRLESLLDELGRRAMTNVLVEGGSHVLGSFFAAAAVDEVHVFIAPKVLGGGLSAVSGPGSDKIAGSWQLENVRREWIDGDTYISGRVVYGTP